MNLLFRHIKWLIILFFLNLLFLVQACAQNREYLLKAVFIEKFARYTIWPDDNAVENSPFIIIIYGPENISEVFSEVYKNKKIKSKIVKIVKSEMVDSTVTADAIFLTDDYQKKLFGKIRDTYADKPVLIITESKGLARKGAHINFYITPDETLHFEINKETIGKSQLKLNFLLLDIARIVKQEK